MLGRHDVRDVPELFRRRGYGKSQIDRPPASMFGQIVRFDREKIFIQRNIGALLASESRAAAFEMRQSAKCPESVSWLAHGLQRYSYCESQTIWSKSAEPRGCCDALQLRSRSQTPRAALDPDERPSSGGIEATLFRKRIAAVRALRLRARSCRRAAGRYRSRPAPDIDAVRCHDIGHRSLHQFLIPRDHVRRGQDEAGQIVELGH